MELEQIITSKTIKLFLLIIIIDVATYSSISSLLGLLFVIASPFVLIIYYKKQKRKISGKTPLDQTIKKYKYTFNDAVIFVFLLLTALMSPFFGNFIMALRDAAGLVSKNVSGYFSFVGSAPYFLAIIPVIGSMYFGRYIIKKSKKLYLLPLFAMGSYTVLFLIAYYVPLLYHMPFFISIYSIAFIAGNILYLILGLIAVRIIKKPRVK